MSSRGWKCHVFVYREYHKNPHKSSPPFGVLQIILTALLIGLYAWWGFAEWEASLVLGLGFAQSSTVVLVQLLK